MAYPVTKKLTLMCLKILDEYKKSDKRESGSNTEGSVQKLEARASTEIQA